MTSVILESVSSQAEFVAVVIDSEDQGWSVAAAADHEGGVKTYPGGIPFAQVEDQVAQQLAHYVLRTRETVVLPNILEDERFSVIALAVMKVETVVFEKRHQPSSRPSSSRASF